MACALHSSLSCPWALHRASIISPCHLQLHHLHRRHQWVSLVLVRALVPVLRGLRAVAVAARKGSHCLTDKGHIACKRITRKRTRDSPACALPSAPVNRLALQSIALHCVDQNNIDVSTWTTNTALTVSYSCLQEGTQFNLHVPVDSDDENSSDEEDGDMVENERSTGHGGTGREGAGADLSSIHLSDLSLSDPELGHRQSKDTG